MAPTQFKLSKAFNSTRRITFALRPTWPQLVTRIAAIYDIPDPSNIGVKYVDVDGDVITLSTDEELQDFYLSTLQPGATINFTIVDLSQHGEDIQQSPLGFLRESRNTFGQDAPFVFGVDEDWQRISGLGALGNNFMVREPEGPHAFVEVLPSDASIRSQDDDKSVANSDTSLDHEDPLSTPNWKGKARVVDDTGSGDSSASVLASESPEKFPIHAYAVQHNSLNFAPNPIPAPRAPSVASSAGASTIVPSQPTHKASQDGLRNGVAPATSTADAEVPVTASAPSPAPEVSQNDTFASAETPGTASSASLHQDVASLLTTASMIFTQHPELSEGIRNLCNNAVNGAYFSAHREAMAQAAREFHRTAQQTQQAAQQGYAQAQRAAADFQSAAQQVHVDAQCNVAEMHRAAEDEATRRVAEALGGIFRAFAGPAAQTAEGHENPVASTNGPSSPTPPGAYPDAFPPWANNWLAPFQGYQSRDRYGGLLRNPFAAWASGRPGVLHRQSHMPSFAPSPPPPPPPAAFQGVSLPPPPPVNNVPPPPPPPGLPPPHIWNSYTNASASPLAPVVITPQANQPSPNVLSHPVQPRVLPPSPPSERIMLASDPARRARANEADLRTQLENVKKEYKELKEQYRAERQRRKNISGSSALPALSSDDEHHDNPPTKHGSPPRKAPSTATAAGPELVSIARGGFPQLELSSVPANATSTPPRRANTHHGQSRPKPTPPQVERSASGPDLWLTCDESRTIAERLADMGFSSAMYAGLPDMIKNMLQGKPPLSKDEEDEIVALLLEELLSFSPPRPVASGSGHQLPGV